MPPRRRGRPWRTLRAHILATQPNICAICGTTVNLALPGTHPDGPHVDHRTPIAHGGQELDPTNCRITHNHCNLTRGTKTDTPTNSRPW